MVSPLGKAWRRPLAALAFTTLLPVALPAAIPGLGEAAPDFELPSAAGTSHTLSAILERLAQ